MNRYTAAILLLANSAIALAAPSDADQQDAIQVALNDSTREAVVNSEALTVDARDADRALRDTLDSVSAKLSVELDAKARANTPYFTLN